REGHERSRGAGEAHQGGPRGRQPAARRVDEVDQADARHLGRGGAQEQHQGPVVALLAELAERDATGGKAAIYAELKRLGGVPMVALIFRHLATRSGVLEWAWEAIGPAWRTGS